MNRTTYLLPLLVLVTVCVLWPASLSAAPPWQSMGLFKRLEADPEQMYPVTEENGPWMILAVTFQGEHAEEQARELVHVLRSEYKLPAYTHYMDFDYSEGTIGRGFDRYGTPKKMKYRHDRLEEIGVLVGDYPSADDPEAQKVLERLKFAKPACMDLKVIAEEGETVSRPLAALRVIQQALLADGELKKQKGPMGHAFIASNPLLPKEYFVPKGIDRLVVQMNKNVPHSLLNCPGRYSVRVGTFTGMVITNQEKIKKIEEGGNMPSRLERAAENAHKLTEALRAKGYEAYEYHDRGSSVVTVGSFESVGTPRTDGKIEINPQIHKIMQTFGADKTTAPGQAIPTVGQPKKLAGIAFDIQPLPVEVPKQSVVVDYDQNNFTLR